SQEGPSLVGITDLLSEADIRATIREGMGRMEAFPHLLDADVDAVIQFLAAPVGVGRGGRGRGRASRPEPEFPPGPVVGSGGARSRTQPGPARGVVVPYPEGVPDTPRYVINAYGTIGTLMKPPYTTVTKYDLNIPAI